MPGEKLLLFPEPFPGKVLVCLIKGCLGQRGQEKLILPWSQPCGHQLPQPITGTEPACFMLALYLGLKKRCMLLLDRWLSFSSFSKSLSRGLV